MPKKKKKMMHKENSKYGHTDCKTIKILNYGVKLKLKYWKAIAQMSRRVTSINDYTRPTWMLYLIIVPNVGGRMRPGNREESASH